ncbi:MAG: hypothetical protein ACYTEZ_06555 [Planctomycetota bacterium]|jgi:heme/copper-type cytochrome/quinol oxidase subunit 2
MFDPTVIRWLGYVLLFLLVAPLFPFIYVVLRWRAEGRHEPGAGTHAALLYFVIAGILLALAGAANLTYGWVSTTELDEELHRLSWGMFLGSLVFLLLNVGLLRLQGPRPELRDARRVFAGFLMVMSGLVAFTVLVLLFVTIFQKTDPDNARELTERSENLKLYGSWTAYYLATYFVTVATLARSGRS